MCSRCTGCYPALVPSQTLLQRRLPQYMAHFGLPDETCLTYKASDSSVLEPPPFGLTKKDHHCPKVRIVAR